MIKNNELVLETTKVFTQNYDALLNDGVRFVVNTGGSRSSKSWSILQMIVVYCISNPKKVVSIVRKSFPSLKKTVLKDFFNILKEYNLYDERSHNKTDSTYIFPNGSEVQFFSLDDSQKIRGSKRNLLFMNEANEIDYESFQQLNFRTTEKVFLDWNPSEDTWIGQLENRLECISIHSTFRDNPFLEKSLIIEIEALKHTDPELYQIYNLGLSVKSEELIYSHHQQYIEEQIEYDETVLGLDFGFKHPTALIECNFRDDSVYVKELIYESHLTSDDLIVLISDIFTNKGWSKSKLIVADYARPEMIEDLRRSGFNVVNANKSVKAGIDSVKSIKLFYHINSRNIVKEFNNYKWKKVNDRILDEPVKLWDDALDAMRYAIHYHKKVLNSKGSWDFASF